MLVAERWLIEFLTGPVTHTDVVGQGPGRLPSLSLNQRSCLLQSPLCG
jgi:hypothetical protein